MTGVGGARLGVFLHVLVLLWAAILAPGAQGADTDSTLERRVKAAFLFQFLPYIERPLPPRGPSDAPFVIAVVGGEDIVAEFGAVIGGRTVAEKPVVVRRWRESDLNGGPHIVYVRRSESARLPIIARAAQATATLVVTESDGALGQGSMINFQIVDGRVRFDVALDAIEAAGLRISSRLLAVARNVRSVP